MSFQKHCTFQIPLTTQCIIHSIKALHHFKYAITIKLQHFALHLSALLLFLFFSLSSSRADYKLGTFCFTVHLFSSRSLQRRSKYYTASVRALRSLPLLFPSGIFSSTSNSSLFLSTSFHLFRPLHNHTPFISYSILPPLSPLLPPPPPSHSPPRAPASASFRNRLQISPFQ